MKLTKILAAAFSALIFASCGNSNSQDVLRMNTLTPPDSFFPWESAATDTAAINYNIYEGLMGFNSDSSVFPLLAENYTISEDKLTYTFKIRQNVKFHDGQELTAEDVVWTYQNLAGLNGYTKRNDKLAIIADVKTGSDNTVVFTLKKPAAGFILLAIQPILKKDFPYGTTNANGTGPYIFQGYELNQKVTLVKNENYWNPSRMAKIPTVEIHVVSDEGAAISALQSGQLDMIQKVTKGNADSIKDSFKIAAEPQNYTQIFGMNSSKPELSDLNVRLAISCAVNKKECIEGALDGAGITLYSNFSPLMKQYYNDQLENVTPFNLEKAKEYMARSKYPEGFNLKITVPASYPMHVDTAQIIAKQLEAINIHCTLELIEWATWLDQVYSKANYESTVISFSGKLDPSEILIRYKSDYKKNFTRFNNADYDKAFNAAVVETDTEKRVALYKECQKILAEQAPAVYITDMFNIVVMKKNLNGYKQYPAAYYNISEMYFD